MAKKINPDGIIDEQMKSIGEKVRELRKKKNENYEAWSYLNNINKVTLSRVEHGENVTFKKLLEIIHKLEISPEEFFNGIH